MEEVIKPEAFVLNVMRQKLHPQFIYSPPEEYEPPQGRNSKSARDNNDALRGKVNSWVKEGYVCKIYVKVLDCPDGAQRSTGEKVRIIRMPLKKSRKSRIQTD